MIDNSVIENEKQLVDLTTVAKTYGIPRKVLVDMCKANKIPHVILGGKRAKFYLKKVDLPTFFEP